MANLPDNCNLAFDTEMSIDASTFTGASQLIGTLSNIPVKLLIKNLTDQQVFFADNPGSSKGTTMAVGEEIILDCKLNSLNTSNSFRIGTKFYVTGSAGTGLFKISILYAI